MPVYLKQFMILHTSTLKMQAVSRISIQDNTSQPRRLLRCLDSFIENVGFDEYLFTAIVGLLVHSECPISVDTQSIEMGTAGCCHILDN
jgi:hypothetical protein